MKAKNGEYPVKTATIYGSERRDLASEWNIFQHMRNQNKKLLSTDLDTCQVTNVAIRTMENKRIKEVLSKVNCVLFPEPEMQYGSGILENCCHSLKVIWAHLILVEYEISPPKSARHFPATTALWWRRSSRSLDSQMKMREEILF